MNQGRTIIFGISLLVVAVALYSLSQSSTTFFVANNNPSAEPTLPGTTPLVDDPQYALPDKDPINDILLLGIRGKDDVENGGFLSDTILLLRVDESTNKAALISIPRDLTVRVTDARREKINTAYITYGSSRVGTYFSRVLGVRVDHVVVVDFTAFKSVVDAMGGVSITLDKPFSEGTQWGYEFSLPAGTSTLTGDQALYYVRSRYGSSDFDRSRRQMQMILAMKEKLSSLDPIKLVSVLNTVRKHIETDMNIFDIASMRSAFQSEERISALKRYQLTPENVLVEATENGIYELLHYDNDLNYVKRFIQTSLSGSPAVPTRTPAPTP
jgi:LCP family protein required for cell wall assembly